MWPKGHAVFLFLRNISTVSSGNVQDTRAVDDDFQQLLPLPAALSGASKELLLRCAPFRFIQENDYNQR